MLVFDLLWGKAGWFAENARTGHYGGTYFVLLTFTKDIIRKPQFVCEVQAAGGKCFYGPSSKSVSEWEGVPLDGH
jgi:hypothetical protein